MPHKNKSRSTASVQLSAYDHWLQTHRTQSTDKQTNGRKDGCYQVHYLPASLSYAADKNDGRWMFAWPAAQFLDSMRSQKKFSTKLVSYQKKPVHTERNLPTLHLVSYDNDGGIIKKFFFGTQLKFSILEEYNERIWHSPPHINTHKLISTLMLLWALHKNAFKSI